MNITSASFREKSAWVILGAILVVFVPYFTFVFRLFAAGQLVAGAVLGLFIGATIWMILLTAGFHIALSLFSRADNPDERDRAIELKSFRVAYAIMAITFFCAIGAMVVLALPSANPSGVRWLAPVFVSQVFFLCFVLAEIGKYLTQVICHRRGS